MESSKGPASGRGRERLKLLGKLLIGAVAVVWVLRSRMIDFGSLGHLLSTPSSVIAALLVYGLTALLCAVRWHRLARAQGLTLSLFTTFELTMIGAFFNTFMPGSVGGDVIKAYYAVGRQPQRKTRAAFSVFLDRVIGLTVFFLCSGIALVFVRATIPPSRQLNLTATFIWAVCAAALVGGVVFFTHPLWRLLHFESLLRKLHRWALLGKLVDAALLYRTNLPTVLSAVALSGASIVSMTLLYWWQGQHLGISLTLGQYLFVVPVALTVSALPALPGGIGVGQVAFFTLFTWAGASNPSAGGTLCTAMQLYQILFNCLGAVFYLKFRRDAPENGEPSPLPA